MERRQRVAWFRLQYERISSSALTSRGREDSPDEKKDRQEHKLQDEQVKTKRKKTKAKERKKKGGS